MSNARVLHRREEIIVSLPGLIADVKHQLRQGAKLILDTDNFYVEGPLRANIPYALRETIIAAIENDCVQVERELVTEWTWKR